MKSQESTSQSRLNHDTLNFQINSDSGDEMKNNVILFPKIKIAKKDEKIKKDSKVSISKYTSHGKPKATSADSVKTLDEINKIKNYFLDNRKYRDYCLFVVGTSTGYRISDLLRLKVSDFLNDDYSWKKEIDIIEQKTRKRRKMPISKSIQKAVKEHIAHSDGVGFDTYLFRSQKGENKPIGVSHARKIFDKMAHDLNLDYHCSTHFLRKTFAYWFLQLHKNDMSALATLQDILNHSSEKMTLKYCGIEKQRQEQMVNDLAQYIFQDDNN